MKPPALSSPPPSAPSGVFVSTITALQNGTFGDQLDDALREVTAAVLKVGTKGSVTIKLSLAPNGVGAGDVPLIKLVPKISKNVPEKPAMSQAFYADEDNNLSRRHPGQGEMKLELVRGDASAADAATPVKHASAQ